MEAHAPTTQQGGPAQRLSLDPVSRVVGALSFDLHVDRATGAVREGRARATLFRGYELLLQGRDARDAVFVASRACGACGGAHGVGAALACEMAFGVQPPPMGITIRNLIAALEHLHDLPLALFVRSGPDYSEPVIARAAPELWRQAESAPAPSRGVHGYARIGEIMAALAHPHGELGLEARQMSRTALEGYVLVGGKHPHPQTLVPGGISAGIDATDLNLLLLRTSKLLDYARRAVAVWDDLVDFLLAAEPGARELGAGARNFLDYGMWDDPFAYDATLANATEWGERRWATPGAIVDGRLVSTSLPEIDAGVEEHVAHSFYDEWSGSGRDRGSRHPSAKQTVPRPGETSERGAYSWSTAPRWNRHAMETGAYARLWTTALAAMTPQRRFMESTGRGIRFAVPRAGALPAELEWHVPETWGTYERVRARAYALLQSTLVAYEQTLLALDLARQDEDQISTRFHVPGGAAAGTGFWGSSRGALSHHLTLDDGVIERYQIVGPSTWTMSPRDATEHPGPCEQAVTATPEPGSTASEYLDVLRTIRSFDPCMPCAAH